MRFAHLVAALVPLAAAVPLSAQAQETVDIGTISEQDIVVVQRLLHPKDDRTELGIHLGVMPFDAYLLTPQVQLSFDKHLGELTSLSVLVGGGYGFKNATFKELESPAFGAAPDAYRYLGSAMVGLSYAPIYAKMNVNAKRIIHHDVYGVARAGVTFEASTIPEGGFAPSPTVSLGIGARMWTGENYALRAEVRDDIMYQSRKLSGAYIKQNLGVTIGITRFSAVKKRTR